MLFGEMLSLTVQLISAAEKGTGEGDLRSMLRLSSASPKTESENNRPAAPGTVATLSAVNY